MNGLLIYDGSERDLAQKIAAAMMSYRRRVGLEPDTCYVAALMLAEKSVIAGMHVVPVENLPRGHLLIGREAGIVDAVTMPAEQEMPARQEQLSLPLL